MQEKIHSISLFFFFLFIFLFFFFPFLFLFPSPLLFFSPPLSLSEWPLFPSLSLSRAASKPSPATPPPVLCPPPSAPHPHLPPTDTADATPRPPPWSPLAHQVRHRRRQGVNGQGIPAATIVARAHPRPRRLLLSPLPGAAVGPYRKHLSR